ncbi:formylglycine-generating enzyme family protein [Flavitalea flava]
MKKVIRLTFLGLFLLNVISRTCLHAQNPSPEFQGNLKELFAGPATPVLREAWLEGMKKWRTDQKTKLQYSDRGYIRPELGWMKDCFIYAQVMAHERFLYDPVIRKYTVDRYLNDLKKRYGGLDAVLIWPTYPNIGIDDRNQYDLVTGMPGGIEGVRKMILDFKQRGVRVFFPIMYWDHGTRKIALSMPVALVKEMKELDADGLIGDTMGGVTEEFRNACDSLGYAVVLQPENNIRDLKMAEWNQMSWGYYWDYTYSPGVSVYKWLEPRHQVHVTNRWAIDKTDELQYAFFNGVGYNAWENIWGIWNLIPERHGEAIRRIASIYRGFPGIWNSSNWEPYIPTIQKGVFASAFPEEQRTVYTLVNRDSVSVKGRQLKLPYKEGMKYFDLWNGKELSAQRADGGIYLDFQMEGRGYGAVLVIKAGQVSPALKSFLAKMYAMSVRPLDSLSTDWKPLPQQIVTIPGTRPYTKAPVGMVSIPGAENYAFESKGVMIEGDELPAAVGVQHPWEEHPARSQKHTLSIPSFYMDRYLVTNQEYKKFIDATHYHPADDQNFLKNWKNGNFPPAADEDPVTWVSLEDARSYAAWSGKRLPHEWEWQYAAQGLDNRLYPWGNAMDSSRIPWPDTSRNMRLPTAVNTYPQGASPFGVVDLVGNLWQWTDEYRDEHTRSAILKGSGYFRAQTSMWYFPPAYEVNAYGKYLLMSPGIDRSGTIGFRCVADKLADKPTNKPASKPSDKPADKP